MNQNLFLFELLLQELVFF